MRARTISEQQGYRLSIDWNCIKPWNTEQKETENQIDRRKPQHKVLTFLWFEGDTKIARNKAGKMTESKTIEPSL